jgi:hypothetical protein
MPNNIPLEEHRSLGQSKTSFPQVLSSNVIVATIDDLKAIHTTA